MTLFQYFDLLQVTFWSLAYICIIVFSIKYKKCMMPFSCLSFNFCWEIIVLLNSTVFSVVFFYRLVWTMLDTIILLLHLIYGNFVLTKKRKTLFYFASIIWIILNFILFYFLDDFAHNFSIYSSFLINIFMSIIFVVLFKKEKLYVSALFVIGFFRLLGTLFASIAYGFLDKINIPIIICGLVILVVDSVYVSLCKNAKENIKSC